MRDEEEREHHHQHHGAELARGQHPLGEGPGAHPEEVEGDQQEQHRDGQHAGRPGDHAREHLAYHREDAGLAHRNGDARVHPSIDEARGATERDAHIGVGPPCLGDARAEIGVEHRAAEADEAHAQPDQGRALEAARAAQDRAGGSKDPHADDRAQRDGEGVDAGETSLERLHGGALGSRMGAQPTPEVVRVRTGVPRAVLGKQSPAGVLAAECP